MLWARLVYVRDVEVLTTRGRPTPVSLPASAKALTAPTAAPTADASSSTAVTTTAAAAQSKAGSVTDATGTAAAAGASKPNLQDSGGQQAADAAEAKRAQGSSSEASTSRSHHQTNQQKQQSPQQQKAQQGSAVPSYAAAVGGQSSSAAADSGASSAGGSKAGSAAAGASAASSTGGAAAVQSGPQGWLEPPPGTTELPTCPVCLERLDEHISGIVTTVCDRLATTDSGIFGCAVLHDAVGTARGVAKHVCDGGSACSGVLGRCHRGMRQLACNTEHPLCHLDHVIQSAWCALRVLILG